MSILPAFHGLLAVNPVPWARVQMAFTLACHIILVPLGVSWAFMTLIANYRGLKKHDAEALLLAQRWSKYMAVTFAVGAVSGTVLTFEFGLLWPRFMGQWGDAFGVPFAFEGMFFFLEAIFISIYIYGWRRLSPWAHFWTGVPVVLAGILGSASVVAANAWMNEPSGFTLDSAGNITSVDPWGVIFNKAMPLQSLHMIVAAYVVGGFLIASVYAMGMLRGRRDRYHRIGFLIPFTVAIIVSPIQMLVGDALARWVYNNQPVKFAAIELVPNTTSDVPETLLGHLNSDGTVTGGLPIPGLASWLSDPSDRQEHRRARAEHRPGREPADDRRGERRPPVVGPDGRPRHVPGAPVGSGTRCRGLSAGTCRRAACSCGSRRPPGCSSVITMEAGWIVTRGRPPAVDRLQPDAGRGRRDRQHRRVADLPRRVRPVHRARGDTDHGAAADEPRFRGTTDGDDGDVPYGPRPQPHLDERPVG